MAAEERILIQKENIIKIISEIFYRLKKILSSAM
jgi:hypothetical protein